MAIQNFVVTSFVSAHDLERYDLDPSDAVELYNPLSSDLTHMRTSLAPSVLKDIEMNQGQVQSGQIFELQRVYLKKEGDLPKERTRLVFGEFGVKDVNQAFLQQKGMLLLWAKNVGLEIRLERLEDDVYWHPTRSASIMYKANRVGIIGQVATQYQNAFGIERPVMMVDLDFEAVVADMNKKMRYEPIPEFPAIIRDIAVEVDAKLEFSQIKSALLNLDSIIRSIDLKDVYQGEGVETGKKSLTLSIILRSDSQTLSSEVADSVIEKIATVAIGKLSAKMR